MMQVVAEVLVVEELAPRPYPRMQGSAGIDRTFPQLLVGSTIENEQVDKNICEEVFVGEVEIMEEPDRNHKSRLRVDMVKFVHCFDKHIKILKRMHYIINTMESFCKMKGRMCLPIRNGIEDVKYELANLDVISNFDKDMVQ